jgi:hypothetical protein
MIINTIKVVLISVLIIGCNSKPIDPTTIRGQQKVITPDIEMSYPTSAALWETPTPIGETKREVKIIEYSDPLPNGSPHYTAFAGIAETLGIDTKWSCHGEDRRYWGKLYHFSVLKIHDPKNNVETAEKLLEVAKILEDHTSSIVKIGDYDVVVSIPNNPYTIKSIPVLNMQEEVVDSIIGYPYLNYLLRLNDSNLLMIRASLEHKDKLNPQEYDFADKIVRVSIEGLKFKPRNE